LETRFLFRAPRHGDSSFRCPDQPSAHAPTRGASRSAINCCVSGSASTAAPASLQIGCHQGLEPRLSQMLGPLLSVVDDAGADLDRAVRLRAPTESCASTEVANLTRACLPSPRDVWSDPSPPACGRRDRDRVRQEAPGGTRYRPLGRPCACVGSWDCSWLATEMDTPSPRQSGPKSIRCLHGSAMTQGGRRSQRAYVHERTSDAASSANIVVSAPGRDVHRSSPTSQFTHHHETAQQLPRKPIASAPDSPQSELGRLLGHSSRATVSLLSAVRAPSILQTLLGLEVLFGVPISDLFAACDTPPETWSSDA